MNESIHPDLDSAARAFLDQCLRGTQRVRQILPLQGDASTRRYFRCLDERGDSSILTVYPERLDAGPFGYGQIYHLMRRIGIPVPEIIAIDTAHGLVLQEDLGDSTLERYSTAFPERRTEQLRRALDYILTMQVEGSHSFGPDCANHALRLDEARLEWELHFFLHHYLGDFRGLANPDTAGLREEFSRIARELDRAAPVFCHRDYQVRNLMVRDDTLYVIDFQDARWGPPTYDLVSLLKDSIQLDSGEIEDSVDRYRQGIAANGDAALAAGIRDESAFRRQFHLMCIQRLLKALGTYGNQIAIRGNPAYSRLIPGTLERTLLSLKLVRGFPVTRRLVESELGEI